ncbi:MAG: late competence development ComFB family protein [Desulfovibrionaceae bacterium]|nr:late competence development ComFB family protein [Desulfovibrionaceae bacterium]
MSGFKYEVNGIPLEKIRNKNERRVIKLMPQVLAEHPEFKPGYMEVQDIYALTLNTIPARYVQSGTIVMGEPIKDEDVLRTLRLSVNKVLANPKGAKK